MKMKKRIFSLIEVVVSMGLAMGVLIALMGFYAYVSYLGNQGKKQEKLAFQNLYIQSRLSELLPQTVPSYDAKSDKNREIKSEYNFFTSHINGSASLTFLFSGGASLDPRFSGSNLGKLYVNTERQLCLATFPSPLLWHQMTEVPVKMEVLLENVDRINFAFFVPLEADRKKMWDDLEVPKKKDQSEPLSTMPQGQWVEEWRNDYYRLPPLVRVEIIQGNEKMKFIFPLSKSEYMIVYE